MNLRDENSKVYTLGSLVGLLGVVISGILFWMNKKTNNDLFHIMLWGFVALTWIVSGTRTVLARKNKWGYCEYVFALMAIGCVLLKI